MTGVQLFLMVFGAVMAVIGVIVFFLLAWFKETTGQDHHNVIKILQAEFRFSNPALVIFAGGLLLMVAPFFLDQAMVGDQPPPAPQDTPPAVDGPTLTPPLDNSPPRPQPPVTEAVPGVDSAVAQDSTATDTPTPTAPDLTGRWRNQTGYLQFRRLGVDEFAYSDFDNSGTLVGQGTAEQDEDTLYVDGEGLFFDGFGNSYYVVYTGDFIVTGDVMEGDLYDPLGNHLGSVLFTRDSGF